MSNQVPDAKKVLSIRTMSYPMVLRRDMHVDSRGLANYIIPTWVYKTILSLIKEEEEQTTSVYQSSQSTLILLLGHRVEEHTCMGLSMRLEVGEMDHYDLSISTMSNVLFAMLQHEKLLWWSLHDLPAHHPGPENTMDISWQRTMVIIVQHLNVWINLHSQYLAV